MGVGVCVVVVVRAVVAVAAGTVVWIAVSLPVGVGVWISVVAASEMVDVSLTGVCAEDSVALSAAGCVLLVAVGDGSSALSSGDGAEVQPATTAADANAMVDRKSRRCGLAILCFRVQGV